MSDFGTELYEKLKVIDSESDDLSAYCSAVGEMFVEVEDYVRNTTLVPWQPLLDPEHAVNTYALLWLAQMAGVRIPIGSDDATMVTMIEAAESRRRGTIEYMVEVAQRLLTGDKFVFVTERDGSAYRLSIVTRTDETPDEDAVRAALLDVKPAGIVLTYTVSDGVTWDEPVHAWNAAGAVTWDQTQETVP